VQWLQDSDYNPICLLCKEQLKQENNPTVRLVCYDVFHWSCLDKYASELPSNTAPAGYQCPKCKECIFPPNNLVSPVVEALRQRLQSGNWARIGLGESLLRLDTDLSERSINTALNRTTPGPMASDDESSNGFVIVSDQNQQKQKVPPQPKTSSNNATKSSLGRQTSVKSSVQQQQQQVKLDMNRNFVDETSSETSGHYNRGSTFHSNNEIGYDATLGMVLNINNLDRDTGDYKYQRRPLFEWLSRWLKSRQMSSRVRMTRQKKYFFMIVIVLIIFFTVILVFSRLGAMSTDYDPALDPLNNPNIRVVD